MTGLTLVLTGVAYSKCPEKVLYTSSVAPYRLTVPWPWIDIVSPAKMNSNRKKNITYIIVFGIDRGVHICSLVLRTINAKRIYCTPHRTD